MLYLVCVCVRFFSLLFTNSVTLIISAHSFVHLSLQGVNAKWNFHNSFDLTRIWNSTKEQHIQTTIHEIQRKKHYHASHSVEWWFRIELQINIQK